MNAPITLEPARYGMTGFGISSTRLVDLLLAQCLIDYCIDAPAFIPRGSLQSGHTTDDGSVYVSATKVRP